MGIIAYAYEADTHCIACTVKWFSDELGSKMNFTRCVDENGVWDDPQCPTLEYEGNPIHPIFSTDEWQELDEGYLAENPTQYLTCSDCWAHGDHIIIEEYTHQED